MARGLAEDGANYREQDTPIRRSELWGL